MDASEFMNPCTSHIGHPSCVGICYFRHFWWMQTSSSLPQPIFFHAFPNNITTTSFQYAQWKCGRLIHALGECRQSACPPSLLSSPNGSEERECRVWAWDAEWCSQGVRMRSYFISACYSMLWHLVRCRKNRSIAEHWPCSWIERKKILTGVIPKCFLYIFKIRGREKNNILSSALAALFAHGMHATQAL